MASATLTAPCEAAPRLWGDEPAPAPEATGSVATDAVAPAASVTLADLVADCWAGLSASAGPVPCLVCGADLQPRWSAGAGVVGGRCDGCGTTLE